MPHATVRRLLTPAMLAGAGLLLLGIAAALLWLLPSGSYIFLPDTAHPVAPLVQVQGGHNPKGHGGIYFVDIFVRRASLLERLFPGIREGSQLVPASAFLAPGVSNTERVRQDQRAMTRSQEIAAAVALRAAGYKVRALPVGALVSAVDPNGPSSKIVLPGDVILAAEGKPVRLVADLGRVVRALSAGAPVRLQVRRGSDLRALEVKATTRQGHTIVGVLVTQQADIKLPRAVRIDAGSVGGPSAGLAFALDILEELGKNVDRGYRVAATGEIQLDGGVSPIGGIEQKTIGVKRSHADVFLVPVGDNARAAERHAGKLRIIPVRNFQQALHALATLPQKK